MRLKEGNKKDAILRAAVKSFAKHGYHNAKVAKIAEAAGVATGSVYVYFEDKEDLLVNIFDELWKTLYMEFEKLNADKRQGASRKIEAMLDIVLDHFISDADLAKVYVNEQNYLQYGKPEKFTEYYDKFWKLGEKIFREGKRKGNISQEVDVKVVRYFIIGAIRNLLNQWANDPKSFSLNKIKKNVKVGLKQGFLK
jgi:TetR/AcrR family fatty acid metabolism transcriptional regulator